MPVSRSRAPNLRLRALFSACPQMNNSDSGVFTVFTGVQNFSRIHLVDKWNGLSKVSRTGRQSPSSEAGTRLGTSLGGRQALSRGHQGHPGTSLVQELPLESFCWELFTLLPCFLVSKSDRKTFP